MPPHTVVESGKLKYSAEPPFLVIPDRGGLLYMPNKKEAALTLDLEIPEDGTYVIWARCFKSIFGGVYQPSMDGEDFGQPLDFSILNADFVWLPFDRHELTAGTHQLKLTGIAQRPSATRKGTPQLNGLGLHQLILIRLEDCEGYLSVTRRLLGTS